MILVVVTPLSLEVILSLFINIKSQVGELAISLMHDYDRLIGLVLNVQVVEVLMAKNRFKNQTALLTEGESV
ncbi:hypothetical protein [Pseudoalteromonas piscicida]|uniref:Uncharacterized protein n=1 Tax=Pseudoalteromonas piscicida TaxID=43662 RepID=A0AAD0RMF0_PSEO7|nr:hypothetical protein [Pseudoalteromonas piscicida]ASD68052.1 hypothetical protein B1L02_14240 [Pseudoalteromonas piscicida]AXR01238.1 hypothetical protein D0511_03490 [Pseudoalteromonas piscicida]